MKLVPLAVCTALLSATLMSGVAQAATVTYSISLVSTFNNGTPESGSGTFTVDVPTLGSSVTDTPGHGLDAVNITIDNQLFTLANASFADVGFNFNGSTEVMNSFTFNAVAGVLQLTAGLTTFNFEDTADFHLDGGGTTSISLAPTPIPSALPLFAAGLAFVGFFMLRSKRSSKSGLAVA
jgi:hypothetical protein